MSPLSLKLRNGSDLTRDDIAFLEGLPIRSRQLEARHDIVTNGEKPSDVRLIQNGIACRYKLMAGGRRSIMAFLLPGDFCDLHVSILGRMDHSIGTLTPCTVADISQSSIDQVLQTQPRIARALWWATLVDEAILREWLANLGQRSSDRKLAHLLCEIRMRLEVVGLASPELLKLPVTQEELGDMLGISAVHVNRVFQQLKHDHLILVRGREIVIPDLRRLEEFAEFTPDYLHLKAAVQTSLPS